MDFDTPTKAHDHDWAAGIHGPHGYAKRTRKQPPEAGIPDVEDPWAHCTYCGSLKPLDTIAFFQMAGMRFSGSDWKYGFPHKFYLTVPCEPFQDVISSHSKDGVTTYETGTRQTRNYKFYLAHMDDATNGEIRMWNRIVAPHVGVWLRRDPDKGIAYTAVTPGFQTWGTIGKQHPGGDAREAMDKGFGPVVPQEFLDQIPEEWR